MTKHSEHNSEESKLVTRHPTWLVGLYTYIFIGAINVAIEVIRFISDQSEHGMAVLFSYVLIFFFLINIGLFALLTSGLFRIFRTSTSKLLLPLALSIVSVILFYVYYDSRSLVDLSSQVTSGGPLLPLMAAYIAIATIEVRKNKAYGRYAISVLLGLLVTVIIGFPSKSTDKYIFRHQPEMVKLDIRKIISEQSIPESFGDIELHIFWDRGLRQIANINRTVGGEANYYGDLQAAVGQGRNHIDSVGGVNSIDLVYRGNITVDGEDVKYLCSGEFCRYEWNISRIYYFRLDLKAKSTLQDDQELSEEQMFQGTRGFAETLAKNSQYLK